MAADFINYFSGHYDRLVLLLLQHLLIVLPAQAVAVAFGVPVGFLISRSPLSRNIVIGFFSVLYSIPSLAMLTFFLPLTGLGDKTAILVIAIYAQFILLRSTVAGFQSVDPAVLEAANGIGLNKWEIFSAIELPLASPVIVSGVRVSTVSSTAIAVIAATIGSGGIGTLLFEGLRTMFAAKIIWGVVLSASLCLTAN
ncbi:MAG: ABC transporter permease, partial [Synergistaceae bacterium]|nr:ABC transporter permease [Synergistaceae bacterium]